MAFRGVNFSTQRNTLPPATDLSRWRLKVDEGLQWWEYQDGAVNEGPDVVPTRYHLGIATPEDLPELPRPTTLFESLSNSAEFVGKVQCSDGHWAGDYGGPMFLLPGYCIAHWATGLTIEEPIRLEMIRYLRNLQSEEGGWGIHIESLPTMFGTVLNYVALRILGFPRDDPTMAKARGWIAERGGCLSIPQWGKFWLCVANICDWSLFNPVLPEMALLPNAFPFHMRRLWCYARTVTLPMSYLFGIKFKVPECELVRELRADLLPGEFKSIKWANYRNACAKEDLHTPHTWVLNIAFLGFNAYEWIQGCAPQIRKAALDEVYTVGVEKEDQFTNFNCIGPVNKVMNMICVWQRKGAESPEFKAHRDTLKHYMWVGVDGVKMNGTTGSQLWDTSFYMQALLQLPKIYREKFGHILREGHRFIDDAQIRHNHPDFERYYRDPTKGGWGFGSRHNGWIVADCTAEGLKAALLCRTMGLTEKPLAPERMRDAAELLLGMQNPTGGYATCELRRGSSLFEWFNASEVFGEIMVDYDYVECTSSSIQALQTYKDQAGKLDSEMIKRIDSVIQKGIKYILSIQRPDGSWEGMWGVCFTYGTWFAIDGLVNCGVDQKHPAIQKACQFLVDQQKEDGGWGETFWSCVKRSYQQHPKSQVVNTAWAVLALTKAGYRETDPTPIKRGLKLLINRQLSNGDWAPESICGVFNKNCMIDYTNFKNIFPIWALARYASTYGDFDL